MKKLILAILLLSSLSSCSLIWESDEVVDAKKDLLWEDYKEKSEKDTKEDNEDQKEIKEEKKETIKSYTKITNLDEKWFIEIEEIWEVNYDSKEITIKWKSLNEDIEKISVEFYNSGSKFPDDNYTLKEFKKGSKDFRYKAFTRYEVLDKGLNEYIFTAFSWEESSQVKVEIFLQEEEKVKEELSSIENTNEKFISIWKENDSISLYMPEWWEIGSILRSWEDKITYSNINWLKITKKSTIWVKKCESSEISDYLISNYSWSYWNTCRPIVKDKWISFYVLYLEWENYHYEKHYIDTYHNLYWVLKLETWTWISKNNIKEKNTEFKEREFEKVEKVDKIFKQILSK